MRLTASARGASQLLEYAAHDGPQVVSLASRAPKSSPSAAALPAGIVKLETKEHNSKEC